MSGMPFGASQGSDARDASLDTLQSSETRDAIWDPAGLMCRDGGSDAVNAFGIPLNNIIKRRRASTV